MAITDVLSGKVRLEITADLDRTNTTGSHVGTDKMSHVITENIADGTTADKATVWFSSQFTATTGGITISLADSADPLGAAGDEVPTADPEGLKMKLIVVENIDATNYVNLTVGTNGVSNWLTGTTPVLRIPSTGWVAHYLPAGIDALNDGVDDEIKITADTASCLVNISVLYG